MVQAADGSPLGSWLEYVSGRMRSMGTPRSTSVSSSCLWLRSKLVGLYWMNLYMDYRFQPTCTLWMRYVRMVSRWWDLISTHFLQDTETTFESQKDNWGTWHQMEYLAVCFDTWLSRADPGFCAMQTNKWSMGKYWGGVDILGAWLSGSLGSACKIEKHSTVMCTN